MFSSAKKPQRQKACPIKLPTARYLENAALYYVQRYAATTASLRRILQRRIQKAVQAYPDFDAAPCTVWVEAVIEKFIRLGYVNDDAYAAQKTESLRRKGQSAKAIQAKLREKGLAVTVATSDEAELQAALRLLQRKRLGPYRTRTVQSAAQKDLAALARAGFSGAVARAALQLAHNTTLQEQA